MIRRMHGEGKTILLSSHDLNEVERLSTHIGMLRCGRLVASGSLEEIRRSSNWKKVRFAWENPVTAQDAGIALEPDHHVRRDHREPCVLVVILPRDADPQGIVQRHLRECEPPTEVSALPLTLEDIFLSEMRVRTPRRVVRR
jgi:ABC-2 type transport system ATP-binding protein